MYCLIAVLFFPTVSTKYPLHQKLLCPYLYFKFACLSNIIKLLLLFKYPVNCAILKYGGTLTSMWIWSGKLLPQWFLHLFVHTVFIIFLQYLFLVAHIFLFSYTLGRILCDIRSDILNVQYFLSRFSFAKNLLVFYSNAVAKPLLFYNKEVFIY